MSTKKIDSIIKGGCQCYGGVKCLACKIHQHGRAEYERRMEVTYKDMSVKEWRKFTMKGRPEATRCKVGYVKRSNKTLLSNKK